MREMFLRRGHAISYILLSVLLLPVAAAHSQTAVRNSYTRLMKRGMEQVKRGEYQAARDSFEEALRYANSRAEAHLGIGIASFLLDDDERAERELKRTVEINPREAIAYQMLGELCYRKDDLEAAVSYWEKAVELNPSDSKSRARLERVRREHDTEKDFNRAVTGHFLAKYEGGKRTYAGRIVLGILEEAYSDVGRSLTYYPDQEIQIILYSGAQFREVTDAPGWSGGVFDGKIRIPIGGIETETPGLRRLLYHEYTHAVVHAITSRCPTWLNEGLAQYFEGRKISAAQREALRRIVRPGKLPPLSNLEGPFTRLSGDRARYAYLFSLSAVQYMVDNFGMYRVKNVLEELADRADTAEAISDGLAVSYEEFERGWKRSLE